MLHMLDDLLYKIYTWIIKFSYEMKFMKTLHYSKLRL